MLLEFRFSNFRSFYEEQTLSFVASNLKGRDTCVRAVKSPLADKVLPVSILYGANASGKSNTIRALKFMIEQVLGSFSKSDNERKINRMPFALKRASLEEPSRFELAFLIDGASYEYGFEVNDHSFEREWLRAYPKGNLQRWYQRVGSKYKFSEKFKGQKDSLSKITPADSLFLSVAVRSENEQLLAISKFFEKIHFDLNPNVNEEKLSGRIRDRKIDPRTIEFLKSIETGILGYKLLHNKVSNKEIEVTNLVMDHLSKFEDIILNIHELNKNDVGENAKLKNEDIDLIRSKVLDELNKKTRVYFTHEGAEAGTFGIAFSDESEGSKRLVRLVDDAFVALDKGTLFVVDELDASLHTRACALFVKLFTDSEVNKNGAQLFATTHDTNLLSDHDIRRDEAWFVEKDNQGQSKLYSAAEFKVRKSQNLEDVYLDDRFGALPPKVNPKWLLTEG